MLIYFIRHGEPDYSTDTLTEKGKIQAQLASRRLCKVDIDSIHSSPMGRAIETAKPLSEKLSMEINIEEWAYELGKESRTLFPDGKSKTFSCVSSSYMYSDDFKKLSVQEALGTLECFKDNKINERYSQISNGLDYLISEYGYNRNERGFYEPVEPNAKKVALFCHAGMMRVMISHLLNLPLNFFASTFFCNYTGITAVNFDKDAKCEFVPTILSFGDIGHLYDNDEVPVHYLTNETI